MKSTNIIFLLSSLLGMSVTGCSCSVISDKSNSNTSVKQTVQWYDGLPLVAEGVHMKKGTHNYVIDDIFYSLIQRDIRKEMVVNAFKEVCSNLNKYTTSLEFNLLTTVSEVADSYGVPKIDSIGEEDVVFTFGPSLEETKATYSYDKNTKETKDIGISFYEKEVLSLWKFYNKTSELYNPYNTVIYTLTMRLTLETMGFVYFENEKSIMNDIEVDEPITDLTEYDIGLLSKYCTKFYSN